MTSLDRLEALEKEFSDTVYRKDIAPTLKLLLDGIVQ